jgi:hypothetical protein
MLWKDNGVMTVSEMNNSNISSSYCSHNFIMCLLHITSYHSNADKDGLRNVEHAAHRPRRFLSLSIAVKLQVSLLKIRYNWTLPEPTSYDISVAPTSEFNNSYNFVSGDGGTLKYAVVE